MKLFNYQTYYIATDANHVTQHRRIVTPWFYVRLKSIKYRKMFLEGHKDIYWWVIDEDRATYTIDVLISTNAKVNETLNMVTMVFNQE